MTTNIFQYMESEAVKRRMWCDLVFDSVNNGDFFQESILSLICSGKRLYISRWMRRRHKYFKV